MKKVVIFYFSGTGNTWWVSEKLAELLSRGETVAEAVSIEKITATEADELVASADLCGFGYPVYGSDIPLIMVDFIMSLSPVEKKEAFIFCTQWKFSGDGARTGWEFLADRGFSLRWGEHFFMPNNVCITAFAFLPYTNNKFLIRKRLNKTEKKIVRFRDLIEKNENHFTGFNNFSMKLGSLQRVPFRKAIHKFRDIIKVDEKKCTDCGLCVELCPSDNLYYDENNDGIIKTKGSCVMCLRCYNFCPVSAIKCMELSHGIRKKPYRGPVESFNPAILR